MFERFDEGARHVMGHARLAAIQLGSEFIGTQHILVGLLVEGGAAARALERVHVDVKRVYLEIGKMDTPGGIPLTEGQVAFSPHAKRAIELAAEEGFREGQAGIGTELLLLGVLAQEDGTGAQVLRKLGVRADDLRRDVLMRPPEIP